MNNLPAVPRRISAALLNSYSAGVVSRVGLEYVAIGRNAEIAALMSDLETVENGGSSFRLITGRYGSGKSFLIQLMRCHATDRGFAVADADLSPERRLAGSQGQGLATYRELMRSLSSKASPDGGALGPMLSRFITSLQLEQAKKESLPPDSPRLSALTELALAEKLFPLSDMVHGYDFSAVIRAYYRGVTEHNEELRQAALKWLRGEYDTKTQAKRELSVSSIVTDDTWYDTLKLVSALCVAAGMKGLIIFIDETVNLYKIVQSVSRDANYEKLLNIFNDCMQGRLSHMAFIFGGTPQLLEDTRRGLYSYEALRSRLAESRFSKSGVSGLCGPVIRLAPLTPEELLALLKRLTVIFSLHYEWTAPVSDAQLADFVSSLTSRMGAQSLLTPREVVRDYLGLLNALFQDPAQTFDRLAAECDIKPAASAKQNGSAIEFEL